MLYLLTYYLLIKSEDLKNRMLRRLQAKLNFFQELDREWLVVSGLLQLVNLVVHIFLLSLHLVEVGDFCSTFTFWFFIGEDAEDAGEAGLLALLLELLDILSFFLGLAVLSFHLLAQVEYTRAIAGGRSIIDECSLLSEVLEPLLVCLPRRCFVCKYIGLVLRLLTHTNLRQFWLLPRECI